MRVDWQRPAVRRDLPVGRVLLVENEHQARSLDDFPKQGHGVHPWHARRKTPADDIVFAVFGPSLLHELRSPRLIWQPAGETPPEIEELFAGLHVEATPRRARSRQLRLPHTREIRFPVCSSRRRCAQIRRTFGCSRYSGSGILQPLRRKRYDRHKQDRRCRYGSEDGFRAFVRSRHLTVTFTCAFVQQH
jgi:hypothetical protein